jgi:hypothetical protein
MNKKHLQRKCVHPLQTAQSPQRQVHFSKKNHRKPTPNSPQPPATGEDPWPRDFKHTASPTPSFPQNIATSQSAKRISLEKWEQHFAATRVCLPRQARQERLAFQTNHKVSGFAHLLARTPDSLIMQAAQAHLPVRRFSPSGKSQ